MAEQQGKYLARVLNAQAGQLEAAEPEPFQYRHLGSMASIGELERKHLQRRHWCRRLEWLTLWLQNGRVP